MPLLSSTPLVLILTCALEVFELTVKLSMVRLVIEALLMPSPSMAPAVTLNWYVSVCSVLSREKSVASVKIEESQVGSWRTFGISYVLAIKECGA